MEGYVDVEEQIEADRRRLSAEIKRRAISQISGHAQAVTFPDLDSALKATRHLLVCHRHHFMLVGEQQTIVASPLAFNCLHAAGLL